MDKKLCKIMNSGPIPELGGIRGPITKPTELPMDLIRVLLNEGYTVYEVNRMNKNEKVKLTYANVNKVNFFKKVKKTKPVTVKSYRFPEGRRNTAVVEQPSEATKVKEAKKKETEEKPIQELKHSDF